MHSWTPTLKIEIGVEARTRFCAAGLLAADGAAVETNSAAKAAKAARSRTRQRALEAGGSWE